MSTATELKAGYELDLAVAKAMGIRILSEEERQSVSMYSIDPDGCSEAKQWLREQGWDVAVTLFADGEVYCHASRRNGDDTDFSGNIRGAAEPEAISRLVLAVAGAK